MRVARAGSRAARVVTTVLVTAAVVVIGASAVTVWWLRRDAGRVASEPTSVARVAAAVEPVERTRMQAVPRRRETGDAPNEAAEAPGSARSRDDARPSKRPPSRAAGSPGGVPAAASGAASPEARDATAARDDREIERTVEGVVAGMRAAGDTRGLAAIPPRGTNPVKSGIVVPKDYELPEGYIRHYQTTDDGKRLEAILMFSPDYDFVDEHGNPIQVPDDGIVPPDMAPADIPLRRLEVPADDAPHAPTQSRGDR